MAVNSLGSPLGRRLVVLTVAVSSAMALLVTTVQLLVEYRRDVGGIDAHFSIIEQSYLPSIEETVWLLDKQRLETLLAGIARLPDFRWAEVSQSGRRFAESGARQDSMLTREFELHRSYRGQRVPIGTLTVGASLQAVQQRLWARAGLVLAGNAIKTGLVAAFMLLLIDRLVVRRLRTMADVAHRFGEGRSWRPVMARRGDAGVEDEIDELGTALDTMAGRVEQALAELKRLNAELETRVHERTHELERTRDEAENANRAKSEFLSSMSHELRTPMNAILGFGQLLEIDPRIGATQRDQVGEIVKAGRHLLTLIDDLLDLARIEAGRIEIRPQVVELQPLLQDCAALVRPLMGRRGIEFVMRAEPGLAVRADGLRLRQVLLNLLSNAVKYNREQGLVEVSVRPSEGGCVRVSVRDTGAGITSDQRDELFQPFNRLGAEATPVEGTGIGLVISQRLAAMMGGRLGVDSVPGRGSTFWVDLPSAVAAGPEDAAADADRPATGVPPRLQQVLYVDGDPANQKMVSRMLSVRSRVRLVTASTAALAIEQARAQVPDLIVLDLPPAGTGGIEALRELRRDDRLCQVPVVGIGCLSACGITDRPAAPGFHELIDKPIDVPRFLAVVDRVLAG